MSGVEVEIEPFEDDALDRLARADAYPEDPSAVEGVERVATHISHVFLTPDRVYKFRKAVDFGFVRFATRAERNRDCTREVALNRRLAPDVYRGVAPLIVGAGGAVVGPVSEALTQGSGGLPSPEHCVVMRRLPAGRDALSLLAGGLLSDGMLDRLAHRIAAFHGAHGLGVPAPFAPDAWRRRCLEPVEANFRALEGAAGAGVPPDLLALARSRAEHFAAEHADRFETRRCAGRAVDGHGDLHLQHVWFETQDAEPVVIDCIEFDESLRQIDAASEVAFTAMDLGYRGAPALAERWLRSYARDTDDFDLYRVVDFFVAYRAAVRAKVAALAACDGGIDPAQRRDAAQSATRHIRFAADSLAARPRGALVLVAGVVGTGKSTLADALAGCTGGAVIASDRVRKRLAGLAATARTQSAYRAGLYAPETTERVYHALLERARGVLASGRNAYLDATFSRSEQRAAALRLGRDCGARVLCVEARCAPEVARARLARREDAGGDPSDAGPALYDRSVASFVPIAAGGDLAHFAIDTDDASWRARVASVAREIGPSRDPAPND